ncbi:protein of unknown function [Legionella fallonii LLAP-10]|uniref:Uncharacterized protein n=1 Tax=Legionella fallonii LLAP-10 TaxID=1212491 RepID=A0A098G2E3_9GAMM|nr:protein of unknown function [Legionella fallonii LLAP-10]
MTCSGSHDIYLLKRLVLNRCYNHGCQVKEIIIDERFLLIESLKILMLGQNDPTYIYSTKGLDSTK